MDNFTQLVKRFNKRSNTHSYDTLPDIIKKKFLLEYFNIKLLLPDKALTSPKETVNINDDSLTEPITTFKKLDEELDVYINHNKNVNYYEFHRGC